MLFILGTQLSNSRFAQIQVLTTNCVRKTKVKVKSILKDGIMLATLA